MSDRRDRQASLATEVVGSLGGRFSTELGIDVDAGDDEIERWFVAATLFGSRISATVAERTFLGLDRAGITTIAVTRDRSWDELVALLDAGGYARYDYRTATRLQALGETIEERHGGRVSSLGPRFPSYGELREALDELPGWGPVTVQLFLRELRGVWPGADPPVGVRVERAAEHLGLCGSGGQDRAAGLLPCLARIAARAGLDLRDLESGLVRLSLAHRGRFDRCPGGVGCVVLERAARASWP